MKIFNALALWILCAGVIHAQAISPSSLACAMQTEQTKWATLRTALTSKIATSKSFVNRIGCGMKRYAPAVALITGAVAYGCMRCYGYNVDFWCSSQHNKHAGTPVHFLMHPEQNHVMHEMASAAMCFSLAAAGAYFLCRVCGACMEDDASHCYEALTEIARQWDVYKKDVPALLYDRFERYAQDVKNYGVLISLDKNDARKLVGAIIVMSLAIETTA
ncbi:MAG: hypothetical protein WC365_02285 [Candidatus Babeliales bacterium]|jgi:hypothetical protein